MADRSAGDVARELVDAREQLAADAAELRRAARASRGRVLATGRRVAAAVAVALLGASLRRRSRRRRP